MPLLLTGCFELPFHKRQPLPPWVFAPPIEPAHGLELAKIELPPKDSVIAAYPVYNMREETQPIRQPARHRKQPNQNADDAAASEPAAPPNPEVSAIGQLSSGDGADFLQQTENSIAEIERRLNGLNRSLDGSEQKIADHIREFLKQARAALASGDVEGAHNLAGKAQVLLAELTK
jgi:hypothetical protein